jgi:hypothetical protein
MCWYSLRGIGAICIACALFVGCAHHHDASTDDSQDQPAHHGHRGGQGRLTPTNPDLGGF